MSNHITLSSMIFDPTCIQVSPTGKILYNGKIPIISFQGGNTDMASFNNILGKIDQIVEESSFISEKKDTGEVKNRV